LNFETTYINFFRDLHQLAALFPAVEEDTLLILCSVSEDSLEELRFEITLGRPHLQAVKNKSHASFNQAFEDVEQTVCTILLVLLPTLVGANCHLVPVLECLRLVKELHSLQEPHHHLSAFTFLLQDALPPLDNFAHLGEPVVADNFLVAAS